MKKIEEILVFAEEVDAGTLMSSPPHEEISFECQCGWKIRKIASTLTVHSIVVCPNKDCVESYSAEIEGGEYSFVARRLEFHCSECSQVHSIPYQHFDTLKGDQARFGRFPGCNKDYRLSLKPQVEIRAANP